ncbi:MAG TPA: acyclic terpene utilization AtuA family protein [Streptosporangiaceae bacterium]|nr:acyclic terpene utilization AtuA family protein [Streptosporangiaceae bacterium]
MSASAHGVGIIFPTGMLGGGFTAESVKRGIAMGATAIAVDGGSTDSGPYYLGASVAKTDFSAVERDLRILLAAARENRIPLIVGSCGTAGTDAGVDWVAGIAIRIAAQDRLSFRLARIYSELDAGTVIAAIDEGRVRSLPPAGELTPGTVRACAHIVALMGHDPIVAALEAGAEVVLAGRATDTSMVAAVALTRGMPAGPAWHAAKTVECGGQCTTNPTAGGVFVRIDDGGFTVSPLAADAACTPASVAAHMLYENADPFRLLEPTGTLDTTAATYTALDERTVRVEGSRFEPSPRPTAKLEGARLAGHETISIVGIRDPHILARLDLWLAYLRSVLEDRVRSTLELDSGQYEIALQCYGASAVLGPLEGSAGIPREVGLLFKARAASQETATAIAKVANPVLLHLPLPGMDHLPSFAFATSPPEIERGPSYEFVLNHVMELEHGNDLFRIDLSEVTSA